ncbi:MAG: hypothetical protein ACLP59_25010 [Bryobacteraceae bacterium]
MAELKHPLKRRIGMRCSDEVHFGLMEARVALTDDWKRLIRRQAGLFSFDPDTRSYCLITVPAPRHDTPARTGQLAAAMLRNQRWKLEERPLAQQRLTFA